MKIRGNEGSDNRGSERKRGVVGEVGEISGGGVEEMRRGVIMGNAGGEIEEISGN